MSARMIRGNKPTPVVVNLQKSLEN
jgi:hypothetical protein